MRLICTIVFCMVLGITRQPVLAADDAPAPPAGWLGADDYSKALDQAKKNSQALAIFFTYGSPTRYFGRGKAFGTYILSQSGLKSMVRVMVFAENTPGFLQDIRGKMGDTTGFMPQLYLLDPRGNIAGFAASGDRALVVKAIKAADDLAAWMKRSDRIIESADKNAAAGRYGTALHLLAPIEREDRKMTAEVAAVVPQQPNPAATQPASVAAEVNPFARPGEMTDVPAKTTQEADLPTGKYDPGLVADRRTKFEALAEGRLQSAQDYFDRKQYGEAKRLLTPMAEDAADLDATKEAVELLKKVDTAQRAAAN